MLRTLLLLALLILSVPAQAQNCLLPSDSCGSGDEGALGLPVSPLSGWLRGRDAQCYVTSFQTTADFAFAGLGSGTDWHDVDIGSPSGDALQFASNIIRGMGGIQLRSGTTSNTGRGYIGQIGAPKNASQFSVTAGNTHTVFIVGSPTVAGGSSAVAVGFRNNTTTLSPTAGGAISCSGCGLFVMDGSGNVDLYSHTSLVSDDGTTISSGDDLIFAVEYVHNTALNFYLSEVGNPLALIYQETSTFPTTGLKTIEVSARADATGGESVGIDVSLIAHCYKR